MKFDPQRSSTCGRSRSSVEKLILPLVESGISTQVPFFTVNEVQLRLTVDTVASLFQSVVDLILVVIAFQLSN